MRTGTISLMMAAFIGSAGGQQAVQAPAMPAQPAATGPMSLDVVVTNREGRPIPGLQQSDFTLLDNGTATPIRSFQGLDDSSAQEEPTQVVLLVDEVNTTFSAVSVERQQLNTYLTGNGGRLPFPVTMVFLTDTKMQVINQPSQDGNAIAAKLQQAEGSLRSFRNSAGVYGAEDRLDVSLKALGSIATSLGKMRGRKLLVWISPGWWMFNGPELYLSEKTRRTFYEAVVGLSNVLQRSQVVVYAVDPLGTSDAVGIYSSEWRSFLKPAREPSHTIRATWRCRLSLRTAAARCSTGATISLERSRSAWRTGRRGTG